jgi:hypothetical protein
MGSKLRVGTTGVAEPPGIGGGTTRAGGDSRSLAPALLAPALDGASFAFAFAWRVATGMVEGSPGRRSVSSTVCV